MCDDDTIFALSSGAPPAAIAVMRVSGPQAGAALTALAGRQPPPRRATVRTLRSREGDVLDEALVLWLPGPGTATGEDLAELHLHGGVATLTAVDRALRTEGLRPARGGEFTRRALLHGRIDLAQAEGLADLLAAETEAERRSALATTEGQLSRALQGWYERLTRIGAEVEARLDHADEDDVADEAGATAEALRELWRDIGVVLARPTVERVRNGPTIVVAGPPNAGKSSLFNALTEREGAIVTSIAGTTRDILDASVVRGGRAYRIIDTAGITQETADPVERIGVARARAAIDGADLTLWLGDTAPEGSAVWINSRCDLPERRERAGTVLDVSVLRPATVNALWQYIEATVGDRGTASFLLSERQRQSVMRARCEIHEASDHGDDLVVAECIRRAAAEFDALLGRNAPEATLDALFSRFCIGK